MALARLVVPNSACIAIFVTVLIPMAQTSGVNPWVVGFVVLVFSDGWIFPYQCSYFLLFRDMSTESGLFDQRALLRFSIATNVFRLAAVYLSLPYWHWLGML
jgi:DASS family divalent anion:Na+ symporter